MPYHAIFLIYAQIWLAAGLIVESMKKKKLCWSIVVIHVMSYLAFEIFKT